MTVVYVVVTPRPIGSPRSSLSHVGERGERFVTGGRSGNDDLCRERHKFVDSRGALDRRHLTQPARLTLVGRSGPAPPQSLNSHRRSFLKQGFNHTIWTCSSQAFCNRSDNRPLLDAS
jgi:hypothetical protein